MILALLTLGGFGMSTYKPGNCYSFMCGDDQKYDATQEPCVIVDHEKNTVQVRKCFDSDENQYRCPEFPQYKVPEDEWQNISCIEVPIEASSCDDVKTAMTGQQCCNNDNCVSGTCLDGKCIGKAIGTDCDDDSECKSDAYCFNLVCSKTKSEGEECSTDTQCNSGLGCNLKKCVKIFSLEAGENTEHEKFCTSNFMAFGKCEILTVKIRGSEGILYPPFMCFQNDICDLYYSNGTHYDDYECLCAGYSDLVEGFCGYNLLLVQGVMDKVYKELQYSQSLCTGPKAHSNNPLYLLECNSITREQITLYANIYLQHAYYNIYVTGALDSCSKDYGLWDYSYSFRDYNSFSSILAFIAILLIS
jgi:hypothetical protein